MGRHQVPFDNWARIRHEREQFSRFGCSIVDSRSCAHLGAGAACRHRVDWQMSGNKMLGSVSATAPVSGGYVYFPD